MRLDDGEELSLRRTAIYTPTEVEMPHKALPVDDVLPTDPGIVPPTTEWLFSRGVPRSRFGELAGFVLRHRLRPATWQQLLPLGATLPEVSVALTEEEARAIVEGANRSALEGLLDRMADAILLSEGLGERQHGILPRIDTATPHDVPLRATCKTVAARFAAAEAEALAECAVRA